MTDIILDKTQYEIYGEFGGGGKTPPPAYVPIEKDDTFSSRQTLRLLFVVSEGTIDSIDNVFVNGTPIENFNAYVAKRLGSPNQTPMEAFPSVETPFGGTGITAQLLTDIPYSRAVTSFRVDAVRITIKVQALLQIQDNKDKTGYQVDFELYTRKNNTDTWNYIGKTTKKAKASQPASWDVRINKPAGGTTWEFRVVRLTPPDTSLTSSISFLDAYTEIQDDKLSYPNSALVGITFNDSRELGGSIPTISFEGHWRRIKVPTETIYNPTARTYTSTTWDGTWSLTKISNNCPAWVIYDVLTDDRVGLGKYINETDVDKFSFFELAKYCDEKVSNGKGGQEHRFSFDNQFYVRENASTILTYLLAICNANLVTENGLIAIVSDRPTAPSKLVVNANVIDGDFNYSSSEVSDRFSSVNVTFSNPDDKYNTTTISEIDNALVARYGLNAIDAVLVGCTSEGQARRKARWILTTPTEVLTFKTAFEGMNYSIGEVINVMDDNAANVLQQGLIVNAVTAAGITTITLDRPLTIGAGAISIMVYSSDLSDISTNSINEIGETTSIVTVTALASLPPIGSPYIISAAIIPKPWKVSSIAVEDHIHTITCLYYDESKFSRIDTGIIVPTKKPPYINIDEFTCPAVTGISFNVVHIANKVRPETKLVIHWAWVPPATLNYKATYSILWRRDNLAFTAITDITQKEAEIHNIVPGVYEVIVYAYNIRGIKSEGTTQVYSYRTVAGTSTLAPPINFYVKGTTGTAFITPDLALSWDYNPANESTEDRLASYQLETWTNNGATKLNTYIIEKNAAKGGEFIYTLQMNRNDYGVNTPNRYPYFKLYSRDLVGDLSLAVTKIFSNPSPPAPAFSLLAGLSAIYINITPSNDIDLVGYIVYKSNKPNFVKAGQEKYIGPDPYVTLPIGNSKTQYVAVAAFDSFGKTGLNISTEQSTTPLSLEAITWTRTGLTLSVNAATHTVYWTSGIIYQGSNTYNVVGGSKTWTTGILYIYFNPAISTTALQTTTTLGLAVAQGGWPYATYGGGGMDTIKGGDGQAFISGSSLIAGTVGAAQLIAGSAVITGTAQIANAIITNTHIQDGAIVNAKIGNVIMSTDYSDVLHRGWKIVKSGLIQSYGGIHLWDLNGNTILNANGLNGTYIHAATIDSAAIKTAAIKSAHIGNLEVDTLKIANNAITVPIYAFTAGSLTGRSYPGQILVTQKVVIPPQNASYRLQINTYSEVYRKYDGPTSPVRWGSYTQALYANNERIAENKFPGNSGIGGLTEFGDFPPRGTLPGVSGPIFFHVPVNTTMVLKLLTIFNENASYYTYDVRNRAITALGVKK